MSSTQTLTKVGPGTPTGELMRQYWIPAALSSELVADREPLRVKLLGEELIAFRTSSGKVGVMDHRCPHRCASLFYGRNEEDGIRCIYHGWKFDAAGNCVDTPNLPPHQALTGKVRAKAYPATERHGIVWTYMGKRAVPPPLPNFPVLSMPESQVAVWCLQRECNYLQCIEAELDTSHAGFLHGGFVDGSLQVGSTTSAETLLISSRAPEFKVIDTDYGIMIGAHRPADENSTNWRFTNFMLPFWTQVPPCPLGSEALVRAWVPMDDTHSMMFSISTETFVMSGSPKATRRPILQPGLTYDYKYLPNTSDWYGRWRPALHRGNDHGIDREVQRTQSFSGIEGLEMQDAAITESMGPCVDHENEYLAVSDYGIARARRRMMQAVEALQESGTVPLSVDKPDTVRDTWSGYIIAPKEQDWLQVYADNIPRQPRAAE